MATNISSNNSSLSLWEIVCIRRRNLFLSLCTWPSLGICVDQQNAVEVTFWISKL